MLRALLIYLSRRKGLNNFATNAELGKRMSRRFIGGETLEEALYRVEDLHGEGLYVALDHVGEDVQTAGEAVDSADEYLKMMREAKRRGIDPERMSLSLKLTQMGLRLNEDFCYENVKEIVRQAEENGFYVEIDIEDRPVREVTYRIHRKLREDYENVGVAMQANHKEAEKHITGLILTGGKVRLCKGAYKEPKEIEIPNKADVEDNYVVLMEELFSSLARRNGVIPAIATHNETLIREAKEMAGTAQTDNFEFQMLLGIREDRARELLREGYKVRIYVPYGTKWYPFYMRRLAERPANLLFILRNVFKE